uniref:Uncharacterized protein n=1 Tax=Rhodopseudomonas palustris (strain BisA53) TaxID=316055 RepID=Q07J64_RHOP5
MLKYIGNVFHNILPSVIATCIGAYIVNHYIVTKAETPPAPAAVVAPIEPKKAEENAAKAAADAKLAVAPTDAGALEAAKSKPADKPVSARAHQPNPREKLITEKKPAAAPVVAPATVAAVNAAAPVETNAARDDRRDANDLARAAIERLRNSSETPRAALEATPRLPEPPRAQDVAHVAPLSAAGSVAVATPVATPAAPVAQLPPAVNIAPPALAAVDTANHPTTTASVPVRTGDPLRPTPPAEIPVGERIDASADSGRSIRTVGDDVVSAARSVFHAVVPR